MLRAALTEEAAGPGGPFVLRAEPASATSGLVTALFGFSRLTVRDRGWVLRVRRRPDDPSGPVVHEVPVAERAALAGAMTELVAAVHAGHPPFGPRRGPTGGS